MFKWLKSLFSSKGTVPEVINDVMKEEPKAAPAPTKKAKAKPAKKTTKKSTIDLDSMSKADLLAHAKSNGIKANASLKKSELIKRIKNG